MWHTEHVWNVMFKLPWNGWGNVVDDIIVIARIETQGDRIQFNILTCLSRKIKGQTCYRDNHEK